MPLATRLRRVYHDFPRQFWVVVCVSFIDRIGGTLLAPFFALYITRTFHVGMTDAGVVLGIISLCGLLGGMIGGALTDRLGRRRLILFGLVFSALSSLGLGLVQRFEWLYPLGVIVGLLQDIAGPAHGAMIADILPPQKRQDGFGILRVVGNMSWLVGPTIGGFLANRSFFLLFVTDAGVSCVVAVLFYHLMPETRPHAEPHHREASLLQTFGNYRLVLQNRAYAAFMAACMLMGVVYLQMYNTLSVFLRDAFGVSAQGYGLLLTTSAIVVILLQFPVLGLVKREPPFLMMALGTAFYMVGFGMFGVVTSYALFVAAIVIITCGEMVVIPIAQAIAANFATPSMRGRYMAVYGASQGLPATVGPAAAGFVLDHYDPRLLWYLGAAFCAMSSLGFCGLHRRLGRQSRFREAPATLPLSDEQVSAS